MNFERPLTNLVWMASGISILFTYGRVLRMILNWADGRLWWKLATDHLLRHAGRPR